MHSSEVKKDLIAAIDDDFLNLKLLEFVIVKAEFNFLGIQRSVNAMDVLLENPPSLILLDVMMPHLDGFELCEQLKSNQKLKDIPIIFITSMDQMENKVKGFELGGVDYVTKPFNKYELTARLKTHMALLTAKDKMMKQALELQKDNALKNRLFSIIGHDLRTPLSAIKMQLDFILRGLINPKSDSFMDTTAHDMASTTNEALNLLDNLLGWARSERGMLKVLKEEVNIRELIEECVRLQKMAIEFKNIKLTTVLPENEVLCFADINKIKTVMRNLMSNAIKFTPKNGSIMIAVEENNGMIKLIVEDSGVGISRENMKKILDPTEHFTKIGTEDEPGTGLGLVLCLEFISKHGSVLNIESEVGKGSVFSFELPEVKYSLTRV